MQIWVPPQQKQIQNYVRWSTISAFVILMLWSALYFYDEYRKSLLVKADAQAKIVKIEEHNKKVDQQSQEVITKQIKVKHRTLVMPDGTKLCTDPNEAVKTGCRLVTDRDIDNVLKQRETIVYRNKDVEPVGSGSSESRPAPVSVAPAPKVVEKEVVKTITVKPEVKDSKIEIDAGLVKVAMSNEASWSAIFKIVFTLLFTFFGVKLINFGFRKLEGAPAPA